MITVFGLGFVGLTTALGFANYGETVFGIDIDENRKETLRSGELPFLEPGLDEALTNQLNKNFFITDDVADAISKSEFIFYCVGTPYGKDGQADLTYLFSAIDSTLPSIDKNKLPVLIVKSTVPPSTTAQKVLPYIESKGINIGNDVVVANNPEFLREGYCWDDFINADRIVVGTNSISAGERLTKLYSHFDAPVYVVSFNTGEMIKYLSNTLLATLISYSNEMADIAENMGGIDIPNAFKILHMDKRWNNCDMTSYVYPGCGYGGYCLPKDTNALLAVSKNYDVNTNILEETIKRNESMPKIIASRIAKNVDKSKTIGILGLSFKPNSDDVRDCASAKIMQELINLGYTKFSAYDPCALEMFQKHYSIKAKYCKKLVEIYDNADILVILTAWDEFNGLKEKTKLPILDYRYMKK